MAHRSRRFWAALLVLALAACATPQASNTTTTTLLAPVTTTTAASTTTTTPSTTTTTTTGILAGVPGETQVPEGVGPFPTVVLAHGGSWLFGSPADIRPLADYLTGAGFLTVNASYRLSNQSPGFPGAVDDIACAVRYAASHPDGDGTVAVVGFSAGAHLGALVALVGDAFAEMCPFPGSGVPGRFVGLAGPYDVARLGGFMVPFFGRAVTEAPELWEFGNPQRFTDANPGLRALIVHGDLDGIVNISFATDFHEALAAAGAASTLEIVPGARHNAMSAPSVVGDLIVDWLQSE